ncbi:MAG: hypothetical protein PHP57_13825 [Sideroxydans sp.]|nr:hypothetical protein [Sideroxydans sp.]
MTKTQRDLINKALGMLKPMYSLDEEIAEPLKAALAEPDVPEGWQLVPIIMTEELSRRKQEDESALAKAQRKRERKATKRGTL